MKRIVEAMEEKIILDSRWPANMVSAEMPGHVARGTYPARRSLYIPVLSLTVYLKVKTCYTRSSAL